MEISTNSQTGNLFQSCFSDESIHPKDFIFCPVTSDKALVAKASLSLHVLQWRRKPHSLSSRGGRDAIGTLQWDFLHSLRHPHGRARRCKLKFLPQPHRTMSFATMVHFHVNRRHVSSLQATASDRAPRVSTDSIGKGCTTISRQAFL